jgi:hypothetical protein
MPTTLSKIVYGLTIIGRIWKRLKLKQVEEAAG